MANSKLSDAKKAKNDEFYTQYKDIQEEVNAYLEYDSEVFKNKTILLPCAMIQNGQISQSFSPKILRDLD